MGLRTNITLFPNDVDNTDELYALHVRQIEAYPEPMVKFVKTLPVHDIYKFEHPEEMLPITVGALVKRSDGKYLIHRNKSVCCKSDNELFDTHNLFTCLQLKALYVEDYGDYVFYTARVAVAQDFDILLSEEDKEHQSKVSNYNFVYDPSCTMTENKILLVRELTISVDECDNMRNNGYVQWMTPGEIRVKMSTGELKLSAWSKTFIQHVCL